MTATTTTGQGEIVQAVCGCVAVSLGNGVVLDRAGGRHVYTSVQIREPHTGRQPDHLEQVYPGVIVRFEPDLLAPYTAASDGP